MIDKVAILRAKAQSIKSVLEKIPPTQKQENIAVALAHDFNDIVKEIGEAFPELASSLPKPIHATTSMKILRKADVSYLDLEIFTEQILTLLQLAQRS